LIEANALPLSQTANPVSAHRGTLLRKLALLILLPHFDPSPGEIFWFQIQNIYINMAFCFTWY